MKEVDIKNVVLNPATLRTPAYFKTYSSGYGKKVLVFEASEDIEVWNLGNLDTVKALYQRMKKSGDEAAMEALLYKSKSTSESDLQVPTSWRTTGEYDKVMHAWFQTHGIPGWRMPFGGDDELMLTSATGLVCKGKMKK